MIVQVLIRTHSIPYLLANYNSVYTFSIACSINSLKYARSNIMHLRILHISCVCKHNSAHRHKEGFVLFPLIQQNTWPSAY